MSRIVKFAVLVSHPRIGKYFQQLTNEQINELGGFLIKHREADEKAYNIAVRQYFKRPKKSWKPMFKVLIACKKVD